jgi:hypothetical protein
LLTYTLKTNDFRGAVVRAKELAAGLPGGELLVEDQDEVIAMLEKLRDRKRYVLVIHLSTTEYILIVHSEQLSQFAARALASATPSAIENKMEIDSMASTPFHE